MLNFPAIAHPVVIGVRVINVSTVLSFLKFVRKAIPVGVKSSGHQLGFTTDILLNCTFEASNVFAGLEET